MNIIFLLAPMSLLLALVALAAFWWPVRNGQYDDPAADAEPIRIPVADQPPEPV